MIRVLKAVVILVIGILRLWTALYLFLVVPAAVGVLLVSTFAWGLLVGWIETLLLGAVASDPARPSQLKVLEVILVLGPPLALTVVAIIGLNRQANAWIEWLEDRLSAR